MPNRVKNNGLFFKSKAYSDNMKFKYLSQLWLFFPDNVMNMLDYDDIKQSVKHVPVREQLQRQQPSKRRTIPGDWCHI